MDYPQELISKFRQHLLDQSVSSNTLKNYLSDLRVFLFFAASQYQPLTPENISLIDQPDVSAKYESYLATINPPATVKRRISSLRKFVDFCHQQAIITSSPAPSPSVSEVPPDAGEPVPVIPDPIPQAPPPPPPPPPPAFIPNIPPPQLPATDTTNYNLIKLMPEVSAYSTTKRSSAISPLLVYFLLLLAFITSFFLTYFILH